MRYLLLILVINVLFVNSVPRQTIRRKTAKPVNSTVDAACSHNPTMPNFTTPGRRISETKCAEYIWELKRRAESTKCKRSYHKTGTHVIGGHATKPGDFPHMGAVGWKGITGNWLFKCGSTLISSKHLLTAAHCSKASSRDTTLANTVPEIVRLGDKNIIYLPQTVKTGHSTSYDILIKRIVVHPNYKSPKKYFDIAIIEIQTGVTFGKLIQPACLWTKYDTKQLGSRVTIAGWGVLEAAARTTSPELQAAEIEVIDSNYCNNLLRPSCDRYWCGLESHQLCAGHLSGGVDSCKGDSGGPLLVQIPLPVKSEGAMHYVIGVTSFGIGCARANSPGVYTRVSSVIDWIENVAWGS